MQSHRWPPHQAPSSLGFSRQEYWSRLPFPSPKHESEVAQSCPTLRDPMDCSLPGSYVHGTFQARVLEWDTIAFSANMMTLSESSYLTYNAVYAVAQALHEILLVKTEMGPPGDADEPIILPWNVTVLQMQVMNKQAEDMWLYFIEIQHHDHTFISSPQG